MRWKMLAVVVFVPVLALAIPAKAFTEAEIDMMLLRQNINQLESRVRELDDEVWQLKQLKTECKSLSD